MANYERISKTIGKTNWNNAITHDEGQFAEDGGGKSTALFGQPGKGKTSLMCFMAQMSRCMPTGCKKSLVHDIVQGNDLSVYAGKIYQETVMYRARDMDSFANIIPQNWQQSFGGRMGSTKDLYLWVHEKDLERVIFYSYNHKRQEIPIQYLPPPQTYKTAEELIRRLHWGAINVVLEPQTYTLSPALIQKLREKKMDINEDEDRNNERKKLQKGKQAHVKKSTRNVLTEYDKREVSPSYFWFDVIHIASRMNKNRHIFILMDEVDDIFEARSEGDVWKLIEMLANDWKDLRKHNISTALSTHEVDFIDWRLLPRIDYIIWMTGARLHSRSAIKVQPLVSNLPIGTFLIEQNRITFGVDTFEKIPYAQPAVRIDGLKGEEFNLNDAMARKIMKAYEDMWSVGHVREAVEMDNCDSKEEVFV